MQFYDFLKSLLEYIPAQYGEVRGFFGILLPYVLMACALFTSFFALKCGKWWCALTFFFIGSAVSSKLLLPSHNIYTFEFWILFGVYISIGILCAYFSKYLYRAQLVASMFALVYAALPSFILFFGDVFSKIISLIVAAALAFLSIKYNYILVLATTAFSGSFIFWGVAEEQFGIKHKVLFAVLMGVFAFAFQCINSIDMLLDTYDDIKKKYEKTSEGSKRAYTYVKGKLEKHNDELDAEEAENEETILKDDE